MSKVIDKLFAGYIVFIYVARQFLKQKANNGVGQDMSAQTLRSMKGNNFASDTCIHDIIPLISNYNLFTATIIPSQAAAIQYASLELFVGVLLLQSILRLSGQRHEIRLVAHLDSACID